MIGKKAGGVIVFGGGLALYDDAGLIGALSVSGDTSCANHNVAWRVWHDLGLDHVRSGPSPDTKDAIIYDIDATGVSKSGLVIQNAMEKKRISPSILAQVLEAAFCRDIDRVMSTALLAVLDDARVEVIHSFAGASCNGSFSWD